jgi:hypothetical protein
MKKKTIYTHKKSLKEKIYLLGIPIGGMPIGGIPRMPGMNPGGNGIADMSGGMP